MASPKYEPLFNVTAAEQGLGPGPKQAIETFDYNAGNTYGLAGPAEQPNGLSQGEVAGIVIGVLLGGILIGALATLCWLKRRRLFPEKFGPAKNPHEAPPVGPIDVIRSHSKLDRLNKDQLVSPKSYTNAHGGAHVGTQEVVRAGGGHNTTRDAYVVQLS